MHEVHDTAAGTAEQASPEATGRAGKYENPIPGCTVGATALLPDIGWHVSVELGEPATGQFLRYLTTAKARALAASLVAAADHHDAETARLAGA